MSALTRNRGTVPSLLQADYYTQRASVGLIVTEGTVKSVYFFPFNLFFTGHSFTVMVTKPENPYNTGILIEPQGTEWIDAPGLFSKEQVEGWKGVMDSVKGAGGVVFAQVCGYFFA